VVFHGYVSGLDRSPEIVARAGYDVANPGGPDPAHAPGTDNLVEQDVRNRADERQATFALADDFVTGGKRDEGFLRSPQGDGTTIGY
jgi:hypothetical protein